MGRRIVEIRLPVLMALSLLLAAGGLSVWAAGEQTSKGSLLSGQDADRIRHTLERLSANQEQILTVLQDIEAELQVVKVRVTR